MPSKYQVAVAGLLLSIAVSGILYLHFGIPAVLVVVPFVPFLVSRAADRPRVKECPSCGFRTQAQDHQYCPRDGTRLE